MKDSIKKYADYESGVQPKEVLKGTIFLDLLFGLPVAFLGKGVKWTSVVITLMVVFFLIWGLYLLINTNKKRKQFYLYNGTFGLFLSFVILLASYKLISTGFDIPFDIIIISVIFYLICQIIFVICLIRKINNGYCIKGKVNTGIVSGGSIVSITALVSYFSRSFSKYFSEASIIFTFSVILYFCAIVSGFLSCHLVKYKYICDLEKEKNSD